MVQLDFQDGIILFIAGTFAGFINTVAGGGSLLTLPLMIFLGLPPVVANATNRVAIFFQNASAIGGFKSKGISELKFGFGLGIAALLGALVGAKLAIDIDGQSFNRVLAVVMVLVVIASVIGFRFDENTVQSSHSPLRFALSLLVFFFIGIYGGFIQAGTGYLIIAGLRLVWRYDLVKINSIKVIVVLIYTSAALAVFIYEDKISWSHGLALAAGTSLGGWIGSRWSVDQGEKWIKWILIITVIVFSIKLWVKP